MIVNDIIIFIITGLLSVICISIWRGLNKIIKLYSFVIKYEDVFCFLKSKKNTLISLEGVCLSLLKAELIRTIARLNKIKIIEDWEMQELEKDYRIYKKMEGNGYVDVKYDSIKSKYSKQENIK